jgi:hypothetical protein
MYMMSQKLSYVSFTENKHCTKAMTITSAHKVLHNDKREIPLGRRRR